MKKLVFLIMLVLVPGINDLSAQNNAERLNAFKVGFFTKRLNLTSAEAEKFWPVYNEYQERKNKIQQERIALVRNFNANESSMTEKEMTETGDKLAATIGKESELSIEFHEKLKEVLPPAKVIRFYQAETQYKAQLLNELQNRAPQNRPGGNRPIQQRPVR